MKLFKAIVKVFDTNIDAIVDTASNVSVIEASMVQKYGLNVKPTNTSIQVVNGGIIKAAGEATFEVLFFEVATTVKFIIVDGFAAPLLLGLNWIQKVNPYFDVPNLQVIPQPVNLTESASTSSKQPHRSREKMVRVKSTTVIPPFSQLFVDVTIEDPSGGVHVFQPCNKFRIKSKLLPSHGVFNIEDSPVILVANTSAVEKCLYEDTKIGTAVDFDYEILIPEENDTPHQKENCLTLLREEAEFNINNKLSAVQQEEILDVINKFSDVFSKSDDDLGMCEVGKHKIYTSSEVPVTQRPYRCSRSERDFIQRQVNEFVKLGIAKPSMSPYASPVVLVKKKDGAIRFCVDYRKLNAITKPDVYPLPRIDDTLDCLSNAKYFSTFDLTSGFWQVAVDEESRDKTAFITPDGLFEFNVLPFGLRNGPSTFQRCMDIVLAKVKLQCCLVYLDDIIIYSTNFEDHIRNIIEVLKCLRNANLKLKPKKCKFAMSELKYLGFVVNADGIHTDPDKVCKITEAATPSNQTELRRFLGMVMFYNRFIPNISMIAAPLNELLRKNVRWEWTERQFNAFEELKKRITNAPILTYFNPSLKTCLHVDASNEGIGAALTQIEVDGEKVIAYGSKSLTGYEKNWIITEKELFAVVWGINHFRPYIHGREVIVYTDHHSLCGIRRSKNLKGRLLRWSLELENYEVDIRYKSGKKHQLADCISRSPFVNDVPNDNEAELPLLLTYNSETVADEQNKDEECKTIREKLKVGEHRRYIEMNGKIYYISNIDEKLQPLLFIPKSMRQEILKMKHDALIGGSHLGQKATLNAIKRFYFWPNIEEDVAVYIRSCDQCQRVKQRRHKRYGSFQFFEINYPFERVGIDVMGPIKRTSRGNQYIIVACDYFTKYVVTKPTRNATASTIARFLYEEVICKFGAPKYLYSDQGPALTSNTIQALAREFNIRHQFTCGYNPEANGLVERDNQTLKTSLKCFVNDAKTDWDLMLPGVTSTYNSKLHDTTGYSPFELLHPYHFLTPNDVVLGVTEHRTLDDSNINQQKVINDLKQSYAKARKRITDAQNRYSKQVNSRKQAMFFNIGDKVMYRNQTPKPLEHRWIGPWIVIERISWVDYKIQLLSDSTCSRRCNVKDLELYYYRNDPNLLSETLPPKFEDIFDESKFLERIACVDDLGKLFDDANAGANGEPESVLFMLSSKLYLAKTKKELLDATANRLTIETEKEFQKGNVGEDADLIANAEANQHDFGLEMKSKTPSKPEPSVLLSDTEHKELKWVMMAQHLNIIDCLKIRMEELSTLATGFEVDAGQLRYHLYVWLEKSVVALEAICSYRSFSMRNYGMGSGFEGETLKRQGSSMVLNDADFRSDRTPRDSYTDKNEEMKPTLHEILLADKLDFEAKLQRSSQRKHWLQANEALLRTLLSYCSLHGSHGDGLGLVRMELILLLQELRQERIQHQLLSPLPFPTTLPLSAASVACQKTVIADPIRHLYSVTHDILKTVAELKLPPLNLPPTNSLVHVLRDLGISLSSCVYQSLCDSDNIYVKSSSNKTLDFLSSSVVCPNSHLLAGNEVKHEDSSGLLALITRPNEWPEVDSLRALLAKDKDEFFIHTLWETYVVFYLSQLLFALTACDSHVIYRLIGNDIAKDNWSNLFGGGAKRLSQFSVAPKPQQQQPQHQTLESTQSSSIDLLNTLSKQRMKLYLKILKEIFNFKFCECDTSMLIQVERVLKRQTLKQLFRRKTRILSEKTLRRFKFGEIGVGNANGKLLIMFSKVKREKEEENERSVKEELLFKAQQLIAEMDSVLTQERDEKAMKDVMKCKEKLSAKVNAIEVSKDSDIQGLLRQERENSKILKKNAIETSKVSDASLKELDSLIYGEHYFTVNLKLGLLFASKKLLPKDLNSELFEYLLELVDYHEAIDVLNEFENSSMDHVSNKSAFLCGIMKAYRQKENIPTKMRNYSISGIIEDFTKGDIESLLCFSPDMIRFSPKGTVAFVDVIGSFRIVNHMHRLNGNVYRGRLITIQELTPLPKSSRSVHINKVHRCVSDLELQKFIQSKTGLVVHKVFVRPAGSRTFTFGFVHVDGEENRDVIIKVIDGQVLNGLALEVSKAEARPEMSREKRETI